MRVVLINKSDTTGGAAVVSRRLMEALRQEGVDARMLVTEKLSDSPYVELAAPKSLIKRKFISERLKIFMANGFNRKTLFKIDTGAEGLPLWKHPVVKEADAVLLNWVNQGMVSLRGVRKILKLGKPVIWTMHDMWCMTGICHHAGECIHYFRECGYCPFLEGKASHKDLSYKIHRKKSKLYGWGKKKSNIAFVAVSNWLKEKSLESSLLKDMRVEVIPNAFKPMAGKDQTDLTALQLRNDEGRKIKILFGAARLDDPIKGLDTLKEASKILLEKYTELASSLEIAMFGGIKDKKTLKGFALPLVELGIVKGEENVAKIYREADIVVSASSYETLPGTLVEAQAYGCVPVSFLRGGQADIIDHLVSGYLAKYDEDLAARAENLAEGIVWAASIVRNSLRKAAIKENMAQMVEQRFSYQSVARKYLQLIESML